MEEPQSTLSLAGPRDAVEPLAVLFDARYGEEGLPASLFEEGGEWRFTLTVPTLAGDEWLDRLTLLAEERGIAPGERGIAAEFEREDHGAVDWVAMTLAALAPVRAGRFVVHGSHDRDAPRAGEVAVEVDAGLAFGTGHHGTTAGCLDMLERVIREGHPVRRVLDVGTGSGVLAIAAARAMRVPVLASDIDPTSVRVARANVRANGATSVRCVVATGFHHRASMRHGRADLVMANILAGPLKRLAAPMRRHLAPGARVILSGLLPHQAAGVVATYRMQGLALEREHHRDGWTTLLMRLPARVTRPPESRSARARKRRRPKGTAL